MKPNYEFNKYLNISKIDDEKRMVFGYASTPDLDSQGEIVDLSAIKQALPNYMKFPTIREMHTTNAIGTTNNATIDEKGLFIGAKIVDDNAWKKIKEGVFRGFSIGGRVKQMVDNVITEMDLIEISLVDVPANRQAVITLFKSDKSQLQRDYENYLVKFAFTYGEGVSWLKKQDENEKNINEATEIVEEVAREQSETEQGSEETKEVNQEKETVETVEAVIEEKTETDETEVETDVESENTETVIDEAKQVSEEPTNITKFDNTLAKIEKLEKAYEAKIEKLETVEKIEKAISKLTSIMEKFNERLEKVENTPAEQKTRATYLVEKTLGDVQLKKESEELKALKAEFAEIIKIRETDPARYAAEKLSDRAFALKDKIDSFLK